MINVDIHIDIHVDTLQYVVRSIVDHTPFCPNINTFGYPPTIPALEPPRPTLFSSSTHSSLLGLIFKVEQPPLKHSLSFQSEATRKMSSTRRFRPNDLFRINPVNLDKLTETYNMNFYFQYMLRWPEFQQTVTSADGTLMAYVIGKTEGEGKNWHGHVSAVTVAPEYRRLGLATKLMHFTESLSQDTYNAYFVDLFVRKSNTLAISMYKRMGYCIYRTILNYYGGEEDAYDMRKALARDKTKASMVPLKHPVNAEDVHIAM